MIRRLAEMNAQHLTLVTSVKGEYVHQHSDPHPTRSPVILPAHYAVVIGRDRALLFSTVDINAFSSRFSASRQDYDSILQMN